MVSIRPCPTYDGMPDLPSAPSYRSHFCWLAWIFSLSVYPAFQVFWLGCPRGRWAARPAPAPRGSNGSRGQIAAFLPVRGSRQMPRLPANSVAAPGCSIAHTAGFAARISRLRAAFPHRLASGLCERKSAGSRLALLYAAACLCSFQPVPRLYHLVHHWGYSNRAAARKCRKERHSAAFLSPRESPRWCTRKSRNTRCGFFVAPFPPGRLHASPTARIHLQRPFSISLQHTAISVLKIVSSA